MYSAVRTLLYVYNCVGNDEYFFTRRLLSNKRFDRRTEKILQIK